MLNTDADRIAEAVARVTPCACSAQRDRAERAEAALAAEKARHDALRAAVDRAADRIISYSDRVMVRALLDEGADHA